MIEFDNLRDDRDYQIRLIRLFDPEPVIVYEGPSRLYVQRHEGRVVVVTPLVENWAEYGPRSVNNGDYPIKPTGSLSMDAEDYLMEILPDAPPVELEKLP